MICLRYRRESERIISVSSLSLKFDVFNALPCLMRPELQFLHVATLLQVSKMEAELHQLLADKMDLETKVRENSAAWTQLHAGLSPKEGGTAAHTHVPGRENEVCVMLTLHVHLAQRVSL
jgi:hypothetical protein